MSMTKDLASGQKQKATSARRSGAVLQRTAINSASIGDVPPLVQEVLQDSGRPLAATTRTLLEPRFGYDFSQVRVHADVPALESAQTVEAAAYTVGSNIVFGAQQYKPETRQGQRLIAHELAHVVQQTQSSRPAGLNLISRPQDHAEQQADRVADAVIAQTFDGGSAPADPVNSELRTLAVPHSLIQREPTRPRAATASASIADVKAQTATLPQGTVTAGTLAKMEWESLFSRHFIEPDQVEDEVESSHARYLYSRIYGWIDAQHFFAHIQYAEESGVDAATKKGIGIEQKQALVRKQIEPDQDLDPAGYTLLFDKPDMVSPDDVLYYREDLILAFNLAKDIVLGKQEQALIKGFSDQQIAKLLLDNAMSAWSYEDLVSNQLGVQFYQRYGTDINSATTASDVKQRFIDKLSTFFTEIQVVDNAKTVKKLGAKLPGKERWHAKKMSEAKARKKYPELFDFATKSQRLRIVIHSTQADAEKGMKHIATVAPSVPGLHVEPLGSQYAVYSGPVSHFEAVIMKMLLVEAIPIKPKAVVVEAATPPATK